MNTNPGLAGVETIPLHTLSLNSSTVLMSQGATLSLNNDQREEQEASAQISGICNPDICLPHQTTRRTDLYLRKRSYQTTADGLPDCHVMKSFEIREAY